MQTFAQWSLDAIREEGAGLSWLEEQRFDWTTTLSQALGQILEGKVLIIITDEKRKWFETYILSTINSVSVERPLIPIISVESLYQHYNTISGGEMIDLLDDMISLSYSDNYFFWYIGKGDDKRADLAKRKDSSYFWIFDEDFHSAFTLKSYDPILDIKLLQLFRIFNASLNATMFGEVDVSS
jgi:hypothetical protein